MPASEATRDFWFAPADLADGLVLAHHTRGFALRQELSLETTEAAWVHVDARRNEVTLGVKTVGSDVATGPIALRQRYEVLRDLTGLQRPAAPPTVVDHSAGRVVCQANRMYLENYGNEVTLAADPTSSGGIAARMTTDHPMWTCAWFYNPAELDPDTAYDVYARVRVEKLGGTGGSFTAGVWDDGNHKCLGSVGPSLAEIPDSEWHEYKLATITPADGHYLWCGPVNNPAGASALWLDYFAFEPVQAER